MYSSVYIYNFGFCGFFTTVTTAPCKFRVNKGGISRKYKKTTNNEKAAENIYIWKSSSSSFSYLYIYFIIVIIIISIYFHEIWLLNKTANLQFSLKRVVESRSAKNILNVKNWNLKKQKNNQTTKVPFIANAHKKYTSL